MFHHAAWKGEVYSGTSWDWFNFGEAGVDLFFVISGYIMCYTTSRRKTNIYKFIKARFTRIIPLYWILTSVALFVYLIAPDKINSSGGDTSIFHSFTLLPTQAKYLIENGWTLSYEFFFYIIFSFGLAFSAAKKDLIPTVILSVLVVAGLLFSSNNVYFGFMTAPILIEFIMGIAAFNLLQRCVYPRNTAIFLCLSSVIILLCISYWGGTGNRVVDYGIPSLLFFIGMVSLEGDLQNHGHNLPSRLLGKIGDSSYSAYLVHPFFLAIAAIIFSKVGITSYGSIFVISLVLGSLLTGWICYVTLEKPIDKFIKGKVRKAGNIKSKMQS